MRLEALKQQAIAAEDFMQANKIKEQVHLAWPLNRVPDHRTCCIAWSLFFTTFFAVSTLHHCATDWAAEGSNWRPPNHEAQRGVTEGAHEGGHPSIYFYIHTSKHPAVFSSIHPSVRLQAVYPS